MYVFNLMPYLLILIEKINSNENKRHKVVPVIPQRAVATCEILSLYRK